MTIVLVGPPNVGKTRLANCLTGENFRVANFTGVTQHRNSGWLDLAGQRHALADLPGLYSLTATASPEEEHAKSWLDGEEYDAILAVINAAQMQRSLPLVFQLMDIGRPMVLAVNMMDEWPAAHPRPDFVLMSRLLGIPVQPVSANTGEGLEALRQTLAATLTKPAGCGGCRDGACRLEPSAMTTPIYDRLIEEAVDNLGEKLRQDEELCRTQPARAIALRLLEEDRTVYRRILGKPIFVDLHDQLRREKERLAARSGHRNATQAIAAARVALSNGVMAQIGASNLRHSPSDRIDRWLLHPLFGLPILFAMMWGLFQITFLIGDHVAEAIRTAFDALSGGLFSALPSHEFSRALAHGAVPAIGSVLSFLPSILLLFGGINLLEQSGYMARAAYLLDGTMKRFGLHGRAFIPLITGFGCSVPAYMSAHTLRSPRDRLLTLLVIGFFSCAARLPVYILFISAFFPPEQAGSVLFAIYVSGPVIAMLAASLLRLSILRGIADPFVMDLPRYRLPALRPLAVDLGVKAKFFIRRAGLIVGLISMFIWFLGSYPASGSSGPSATPPSAVESARQIGNSYLGQIGQVVAPVFAPMGFDWKLSVAVLSALAAKEAAVGTLTTLYQIENDEQAETSLVARLREEVDFKTGIAFILVVMTYSPCAAAIGAFFGQVPFWKWRLFYLVYPNLLAWLLALFAYRAIGMFGG